MDHFSEEAMMGRAIEEVKSLWHKREDQKLEGPANSILRLWEEAANAEHGEEEAAVRKVSEYLDEFPPQVATQILIRAYEKKELNEKEKLHEEERNVLDGKHPSISKWDIDPNAKGINN